MRDSFIRARAYFSIPLLIRHGKRIRKEVPTLPEAEDLRHTYLVPGKEKKQLLFIGESTIAGVGVTSQKEGIAGHFSQYLSRKRNHSVAYSVYARSGYTMQRVHEKLLKWVEETTADLIIVAMGGNDAFTLTSPAAWKKNTKQTLDTIITRFPSTPILFLNMPPIRHFPAFSPVIKKNIGDWVDMLGRHLSDVLMDYPTVHYMNDTIVLDEWLEKFDNKYDEWHFFSDGVHPSGFTYKLWAEQACDFALDNELI